MDIQNLTIVNKYDSIANEMSLLINERFTASSRFDSLSKDGGIQSNGGDLDNQDEFSLNIIVPIETVRFD